MSTSYDIDEDIEKKSFNMHLFGRMMGFVKPYKKKVVYVSLLLFIGLAIGLLDPLLLRHAIDNGVMKGDFKVLVIVGAILFAMYLSNLLMEYLRIKMTNHISQGMVYDIRKGVFEHIQALSFRFFDGRPAGKIISRLTNDVQAISDFANSGIITFISEIISVTGIIVILFVLNVKLALITMSILPFLVLLVTLLKKRSEDAWSETRKTVANINANINETLQGIKVIHAFMRQRHNIGKFDGLNKDNYKAHMKATILQQFFFPLVELIGMFGTCAVLMIGAGQVVNGEISIGTIIAFINYLWRFWSPISAISKVYSQALSAMASAERIFQILDTAPEIVDIDDAIDLKDIEGHIEFRNVCFSYNPDGNQVLNDVSFEAKPGEIIALVGPTGAGKTSVINLLLRFYDPSSGSILIDGHDLRDIKLSSFRDNIGMVLQEPFIFSGTIKENILYGDLDADEDAVRIAADTARVTEFTGKFNEGFDTDVAERGTRLSSGQRQLLSFARALVANPKILVLDEATSNVDTETERNIQEALKKLFSGRTSIVIAHRLSTIEHADRIMVISEGRIIEQGRHSELLEKRGTYYDLYLKQFQDDTVPEEDTGVTEAIESALQST